MRIWFNRHFAVVARVVRLMREGASDLPKFEILISHRHDHFAGYLAADVAFVEPAGLSVEKYLAWCLKTVRNRKVDLLVPGHEQSFLTARAAEFEALGCRIFHAAPAPIVPKLHRKEWVYADVEGVVSLPAYRVAATPDEVRAAVAAIEGDGSVHACIKPCVSVYGKGYGRITAIAERVQSDVQDVEDWVTKTSVDGACAPQLVMEYLPGPEYSVDIAARDGEVLAAVVREKPLAGIGQIIAHKPEVRAAADLLVERFKLNGMINVQFRDNVNGNACLLEINPRASGGIDMSCLSGVNLPAIAFKGYFDPHYLPVVSPKTGVRVSEIPVAMIIPSIKVLRDEAQPQHEVA